MDMNDANSKWLSRPAGPYIDLPEPWAGEERSRRESKDMGGADAEGVGGEALCSKGCRDGSSGEGRSLATIE